MSQPAVLQIGEVAKRADISLRTIRYYEEAGLLLPSQRTSGGTRLYSEADVVRLQFIRRLKALGLSLEEIKLALGGEEPPQGREERVNRTLEALLIEKEHTEARLEELLQLKKEVENALTNVRKCTTCTVAECPDHCQRLAYLL